MLTKRCSKCHEMKPLDDFHRDSYQLSGLSCRCAKCRGKLRKKEYEKHREELAQWYEETARNIRLMAKYNITIVEYDDLLRRQNNGCAICGVSPKENGKRLFVDHNHETGEIRGLLCSTCNSGIAFFRDSRQLLSRAAQYVEERIL